jgi:hypothetical protein
MSVHGQFELMIADADARGESRAVDGVRVELVETEMVRGYDGLSVCRYFLS